MIINGMAFQVKIWEAESEDLESEPEMSGGITGGETSKTNLRHDRWVQNEWMIYKETIILNGKTDQFEVC